MGTEILETLAPVRHLGYHKVLFEENYVTVFLVSSWIN